MFSYDHKAGITASAKALRQLYSMKAFKPDMGVKIIDDVCKIKDDFRLQTAATRLEIYELFLSLVQDPVVSSELRHKYGPSCGFVLDLLQVCQSERDPRNLMVWFKILALILTDFDPTPEVTDEVFKVFSAYFPISLRTSATPIGITAEDLKEAVRSCFSAHQRVAGLAFPFLIQKLDQGDAVTVSVKVDILKTIKACVEEYENPQASVVPYIQKIWNSLKYEVRNGEVKETIDATLDVLRAIARKLDGTKTHKLDPSSLKTYIDLVSRDCQPDLSNPTYTKQAGLLYMTVVTANIRAYALYNASFIDTIRQNLRQPKSPTHTRDLILLLNSLLKTRMELFRGRKQGHPDDENILREESRTHLDTLFHDVYLPVWTSKTKESTSDERDVLKQVTQGLALLVSQQILQSDGTPALLCPASICSEICSLLTLTLTKGLTLSSNDKDTDDTTLEDEAVSALRTIVINYTDGYTEFADRATAEIRKRDWNNPSEYSLNALKELFSRFTFIGCSEIPSNIVTEPPSQKQFSPLQHFVTLTASLLELFPLSSQPSSTAEAALANATVVSSLHASIIWFQDACEAKYDKDALNSQAESQNWVDEFGKLPQDWLSQLRRGSEAALPQLEETDPKVYAQFLKLGLFTVRNLYRSAAAGPRAPWSERALVQLSQMAALVVQSLDEKLQVACNLAAEAVNFFLTADERAVQAEAGVEEGILTLGILQGLWPGALAGLVCPRPPLEHDGTRLTRAQYTPGGEAQRLMCDTSKFGPSPSRESDIRAAIGAILANKYKSGPSTSDPDSLVMKTVLDFWGTYLTTATTPSSPTDPSFPLYNTIAMNVLSAAAARQDKHVLPLIPTLHAAASSPHPAGETIASSLGLLLTPNPLLTTPNHSTIKRFHKQWTYAHLAKPLLPLAQPTPSADKLLTTRYRIAVLSVVGNCPLAVYQDDLPALIKLLVTALSDREGITSDETAAGQVTASLTALAEILAHEPETVRGYIREIVAGTTKVYRDCSPLSAVSPSSPAAGTASGCAHWRGAAGCRALALQVLGAVAGRFEERFVLGYAPAVQRMLAVACGDPVRRVRGEARRARGVWARVG